MTARSLTRKSLLVCLIPLVAGLTVAVGPVDTFAQSSSIADEASGHDGPATGSVPVPDPTRHERALLQLPGTGLLLVPESTNDRVMAFDPTTGDLVDPDFIPADPTNLSTPIQAILASDGNSILVSDQINDVV